MELEIHPVQLIHAPPPLSHGEYCGVGLKFAIGTNAHKSSLFPLYSDTTLDFLELSSTGENECYTVCSVGEGGPAERKHALSERARARERGSAR